MKHRLTEFFRIALLLFVIALTGFTAGAAFYFFLH